jgi:hypothetical protein
LQQPREIRQVYPRSQIKGKRRDAHFPVNLYDAQVAVRFGLALVSFTT